MIGPYGGHLVDGLVTPDQADALKEASRDWPSWTLTPRQICDLELLLNGGFSPLDGFMKQADYDGVVEKMRLASGVLWPMPITLDVPEEVAEKLEAGGSLVLRDIEGVMLAALEVEDVYRPDRTKEAEKVFGTTNVEHPGVKHLLEATNPVYVGGRLRGIQLPLHYDFKERRNTPRELRKRMELNGWSDVVAFQTRNPMHRAHAELTMRASAEKNAKLLIHPVVGMTKPGDVDHFTRVRCYEAILGNYPQGEVDLSLLPLAMRMGGPRECLWHAIIRRNYGANHLIVGRDHAGPGSDSQGNPFYGPYDAQALLNEHGEEIGVKMVPFRLMVYLEDKKTYAPIDEVPKDEKYLTISGTQLREKLANGDDIPEWFTFPSVAAELRKSHPPRSKRGLTVFFTGLSGAGKSTVANVLTMRLLEHGGRSVTLLDGDIVRTNLSSELGFSKEHRDINIRRIGFVASEITKAGGIAVCAPIAPYDATRKETREMAEKYGGYVLVHVATPLEVCEQRDRKGLYAKARAGIIKEFTGISDPYEAPQDAEIVLDTSGITPADAGERIWAYLAQQGYV